MRTTFGNFIDPRNSRPSVPEVLSKSNGELLISAENLSISARGTSKECPKLEGKLICKIQKMIKKEKGDKYMSNAMLARDYSNKDTLAIFKDGTEIPTKKPKTIPTIAVMKTLKLSFDLLYGLQKKQQTRLKRYNYMDTKLY